MLFLFAATPIITSGLGSERYGVLSLVWLIIGYFVIFDLGLGSATTRFVAVAIGDSRTEEIPPLVWTTMLVQMLMGMLAGVTLACLTPILVERVFKIPPELISEGKLALWITSLTFPITFLSGSLSGLFAAFQRFGCVNLVKIINSISIYLAGLLCIYLEEDIPFIIALVLLSKVMVLAFQFLIAKQMVPSLFTIQLSRKIFHRVAAFAGWITLSNLINPLMFYIDRFLIGVVLGMSALTYYSVPFDVAARVWVISTSLTMVLFPAFATLIAEGESNKASDYFVKSIKFLVLVSGPVVCLMVAFSRTILDLWVGPEFSIQSTLVLQLLLISTLFDYPAIIASTLLEGAGKPRLIAIVKIVYLPIHALLAFVALDVLGLAGAALSVFAMRLIYSGLFTFAAIRLLNIGLAHLWGRLFPGYLTIVFFLAASLLIDYFQLSLGWSYTLALALGLVGFYGFAAWYAVLDAAERLFIRRTISTLLAQSVFKRIKMRS